MSGDIFSLSQPRAGRCQCHLVSSGLPGILLNILQCTGSSPPTTTYTHSTELLASNVNSMEAEKLITVNFVDGLQTTLSSKGETTSKRKMKGF